MTIAECRDSGVGRDVMLECWVSGVSAMRDGAVSPSVDGDGDCGKLPFMAVGIDDLVLDMLILLM